MGVDSRRAVDPPKYVEADTDGVDDTAVDHVSCRGDDGGDGGGGVAGVTRRCRRNVHLFRPTKAGALSVGVQGEDPDVHETEKKAQRLMLCGREINESDEERWRAIESEGKRRGKKEGNGEPDTRESSTVISMVYNYLSTSLLNLFLVPDQ